METRGGECIWGLGFRVYGLGIRIWGTLIPQSYGPSMRDAGGGFRDQGFGWSKMQKRLKPSALHGQARLLK